MLTAEGTVRRILVALAARKKAQARSNAEDLVVEACLERYKADNPQTEGLAVVLDGELVKGSPQAAFDHHRETVADAAEVADKMIGGDAWGIVVADSAVVETSRTREEPRSLVSL